MLHRVGKFELDRELVPAFEDGVAQVAQGDGVDVADRPGHCVQMVDKPASDVAVIGKPAVGLGLRGSQQGANEFKRAVGQNHTARLDLLRNAAGCTNRHSVAKTRQSEF